MNDNYRSLLPLVFPEVQAVSGVAQHHPAAAELVHMEVLVEAREAEGLHEVRVAHEAVAAATVVVAGVTEQQRVVVVRKLIEVGALPRQREQRTLHGEKHRPLLHRRRTTRGEGVHLGVLPVAVEVTIV